MKKQYELGWNEPTELQALADHILNLQTMIGLHWPWCDAYMNDLDLPCSCGMAELREARAFVLAERERLLPISQDD